MAYAKQTWANGDIITAEKMNHMEDGIANIGGGFFVFNIIYDEGTNSATFDKTWQEIKDASDQGLLICGKSADEYGSSINIVFYISAEDSNYTVQVIDASLTIYSTNSSDGYPSAQY